MKSVRVAVIGIGNIGRQHVRNYFEIPEADLIAIADINKDAERIAAKYGTKFYQDFQEMLQKEEIDAVSVAIPANLHFSVSIEVIRRGKHILIEKPITTTIADAKTLIKEAKKKGIKLSVGHLERFNPAIIRLKELIKNGELGKIISITAKRIGLSPVNTTGVDVVTDLAIHDIDIINYLLGENPIKISAVGRKFNSNSTIDSASIQLVYPKAFAQIETNWVTPLKIRTLTVAGLNGYAELNYITQDLELFKMAQNQPIADFAEFAKQLGEPVHKKIRIKKKEPLRNELEHFVKSILGKGESMIVCEEALTALKIALSARSQIRAV